MKNIIKLVGLLMLIGFSFFYTDKVIEVIREEDEIMIKIKSSVPDYKVNPVDATIVKNTIIPGLQGREVNIESSYKKMKEQGVFNPDLFVYEEIDPDNRLENHQDKYIILGNSNKNMVSLLFILDNNRYLEQLDKILTSKETTASFFIDYSYLINNSTRIKEKTNYEFYSYGKEGKYAPDTLLFSNNLISRITKHNAAYCLSTNFDKEVLELCNKNNLYTINPNIIATTTPYKVVKNNLTSGSMILLKNTQEVIAELPLIIDYIKGKGYQLTSLSQLLSENIDKLQN